MNKRTLKEITRHPYFGHAVFISLWIIINLLQAAFTELAHDEAYYWMYSQNLSWGFFDHPPMVALLAKMGYSLFQNELGVRLIFTLMGGGTILMIYHFIPERYRNLPFYYLIIFSIILVHAHFAGFLSIPDIPLIFFSTLFLFIYKKYLSKDTYSLAFILGIIAACMFYSKYHGVLVILLIVLSNTSLFKRKSFYLAIVTTAVFMLPHLMWQIEHHFPTFTYHLVDRSSSAYKFRFTWNFIYSQLLTTGPLIGVFLLFYAFRERPENTFEKALKFILVGFFIFFFFMSFKGRIEAHWLATSYIAIIVLSFKAIMRTTKIKKILRILCYISIPLIIAARIILATDVLPEKLDENTQFHKWENWAEKIADHAEGRPVLFINKYQMPSKYTFYTGDFATTLNTIFYHRTQYDLWNYEESLQGKEVLLTKTKTPTDTVHTKGTKDVHYEVIDNFRSYFNSVEIEVTPKELKAKPTDSIHAALEIINTSNRDLHFQQNPELPYHLAYYIFSGGKLVNGFNKLPAVKLTSISKNDTMKNRVTLPPVRKTGTFNIHFCVETKKLPAANNGGKLKLKIKKTDS